MNKSNKSLPIEPAHSPFGGSVAARILRCPASVSLVQKVPAHLRKPSAYADRGSALHAALASLLADDNSDARSLRSFVGKTIGSYTIADGDIEDALRPAFNYALALIAEPGAEFYLEHRVVFPGIAGAFGTTDLIIRIADTVYIIDFKFGTGVQVLALYPDGDVNPQLLFYGAGARHSLPEFFADIENIVLKIVQPMPINADEMVSSATVTHAELDLFIATYRAACEEALAKAPRLERGDWCRFCPARPICPAHTAPLLDLAQLAMPSASATPKQAYLQALADGLNLVDAVKGIGTALHDQAKLALQHGDVVSGYALSAGRAERHWRDDERAAITALQGLGLAHDDVVTETMRSPKQVELRAKARGLKIPQELIVSHRSGVSLARCENVRVPVPGRNEIAQSFAAALESFPGGKQP